MAELVEPSLSYCTVPMCSIRIHVHIVYCLGCRYSTCMILNTFIKTWYISMKYEMNYEIISMYDMNMWYLQCYTWKYILTYSNSISQHAHHTHAWWLGLGLRLGLGGWVGVIGDSEEWGLGMREGEGEGCVHIHICTYINKSTSIHTCTYTNT